MRFESLSIVADIEESVCAAVAIVEDLRASRDRKMSSMDGLPANTISIDSLCCFKTEIPSSGITGLRW